VSCDDFVKVFSDRVRRNTYAYFPLRRVRIICNVRGSCGVWHSFASPTKRGKTGVKLRIAVKREYLYN